MWSQDSMVSVLEEEEQRRRLFEQQIRCELKNARSPYNLTGVYCNRTWDNLQCWPDTPAGETATQRCASYIFRFDQSEYVTRRCLDNGSWWINPETQMSWSNYSSCIKPKVKDVPMLIDEHLPRVKLMYTIGYSLSLTTLIIALAIMVYFKRLHCPRNLIHMNMFLAFGLRAALSLMKNMLLVQDLGFVNDVNQTGSEIKFIEEGTHWECKLFFTIIHYIIFASVMWLFNEGVYLQLILSVSVFADKAKVRWLVLIGWGLPLVFVVPWVVCRIKLDNMLCWNVHIYKELFWILRGPMVASVAINFAIFINIVRMLFTKLRAVNCPESKMVRYRKLAKSTLILIPLFAVYHMIFVWLPDEVSPEADLFKMYVEMLFNSFQGFLVALLFCFLNHEVQYEIRKKWNRRVLRSSGGNTVSHSIFRHSTTRNDCRSRNNGHGVSKTHTAGGRKLDFTFFQPHSGEKMPHSLQCTGELNTSREAARCNGSGNLENCPEALEPLVPHDESLGLPETGDGLHQSAKDSSTDGLLVLNNENYVGPESPIHVVSPELKPWLFEQTEAMRSGMTISQAPSNVYHRYTDEVKPLDKDVPSEAGQDFHPESAVLSVTHSIISPLKSSCSILNNVPTENNPEQQRDLTPNSRTLNSEHRTTISEEEFNYKTSYSNMKPDRFINGSTGLEN